MRFWNLKSHDQICEALKTIIVYQINTKPWGNIGFPTGSSPELLYFKLVEAYKKQEVNFKWIHTFNLDEYLDLKNDQYEKSYHYFMEEHLFKHVNIDRLNTHFPCEFNEPSGLKKDYSHYDTIIERQNFLDILILGLGPNGHIGFNEPNSPLESKTRIVTLSESTKKANLIYFDNDFNKVPKYAVSMGLDTILKAKQIFLIVKGTNKKEVFQKLKNTTQFDPNIPVTALHLHKDVTVLYNEVEMQ